MRRRLYFLLPNTKEAEGVLDDLLLKRVCINKIRVLGKEGSNLGTLPEASLVHKYDIMHSLIIGLWIGAIIGIVGGIVGHNALDMPLGGGIVLTAIIGAILGSWCASMIGLMVPNSRLKNFQQAINDGQLLMMVDVPKERVHEIEETVTKKHPQAHYKGIEPTIPSFP